MQEVRSFSASGLIRNASSSVMPDMASHFACAS
jgi:hypothetical protein